MQNRIAYHIVTSLHDSRTSSRMIEYRARERRFFGTKPYQEVYPLTFEEEVLIAETVRDLVLELNWRIAAFNCCRDHIHLLVVCEEEEVTKIMHRLKGRTARVCNAHRTANRRAKGINPLGGACEVNPLDGSSDVNPFDSSCDTKSHEYYNPTILKDKSTPFWAQKFHRKPIRSLDQYWNTYNYIFGNRAKHGLPLHPQLRGVIEQFVKTYEECFSDE